MSDTPRTDEMQTLHGGHDAMLSKMTPNMTIASGMVMNPYLDGWALARMLERELAAANGALSEAQSKIEAQAHDALNQTCSYCGWTDVGEGAYYRARAHVRTCQQNPHYAYAEKLKALLTEGVGHAHAGSVTPHLATLRDEWTAEVRAALAKNPAPRTCEARS